MLECAGDLAFQEVQRGIDRYVTLRNYGPGLGNGDKGADKTARIWLLVFSDAKSLL